MTELKHKTILVTGASSGIGRATAVACDSLGARVILTGRNKEELLKTQSLLKNVPELIVADLANEQQVLQLTEQLPAIDGMVHCAGIIRPLPVKFIKPKHIGEVFDINFTSAVLLSSALLSHKKLNSEASLVFISSVSSQFAYTGGSLYTASKAALEAFCRTLALENAPRKIRANCLAPGLVRTKILDATEQAYSLEQVEQMERQYPLGFGEPEDVANAAVFLLGSSSRWITGITLVMDGGLLLNGTK